MQVYTDYCNNLSFNINAIESPINSTKYYFFAEKFIISS